MLRPTRSDLKDDKNNFETVKCRNKLYRPLNGKFEAFEEPRRMDENVNYRSLRARTAEGILAC